MSKRRPICRCGHRYYKHNDYPLDWPFCKGKDVPKYSADNCRCSEYKPLPNLEYLERKYIESVGKNP
jgi:hypothetical protein